MRHVGTGPRELGPRATRIANLQRAAELPWKDDGRCVVREASQPWPVLAERCFHALDYPGMDVIVNGVRFDALQVGARVLWEIKTHQFDTYNAFVQRQEIEREYAQLRKERTAAAACGYKFVVGVSTQAHRVALLRRVQSFSIVVTGCRR